jgi:hypothetical protein
MATGPTLMVNFSDSIAAEQYLEHRYALLPGVALPLADEDFTRELYNG